MEKAGGMRIRRIAMVVLIGGLLGSSPITDIYAAEYKLAMSEEKTVCQAMLKFANQGLLETEQLERPATFEGPGFESVKWSTIPHADSFRSHNGNIEGALLDINNDGQLDWIVRIQWAIGGLYRHELLTYPKRSEALFQNDGFAIQDEKHADFKLFFL